MDYYVTITFKAWSGSRITAEDEDEAMDEAIKKFKRFPIVKLGEEVQYEIMNIEIEEAE